MFPRTEVDLYHLAHLVCRVHLHGSSQNVHSGTTKHKQPWLLVKYADAHMNCDIFVSRSQLTDKPRWQLTYSRCSLSPSLQHSPNFAKEIEGIQHPAYPHGRNHLPGRHVVSRPTLTPRLHLGPARRPLRLGRRRAPSLSRCMVLQVRNPSSLVL